MCRGNVLRIKKNRYVRHKTSKIKTCPGNSVSGKEISETIPVLKNGNNPLDSADKALLDAARAEKSTPEFFPFHRLGAALHKKIRPERKVVRRAFSVVLRKNDAVLGERDGNERIDENDAFLGDEIRILQILRKKRADNVVLAHAEFSDGEFRRDEPQPGVVAGRILRIAPAQPLNFLGALRLKCLVDGLVLVFGSGLLRFRRTRFFFRRKAQSVFRHSFARNYRAR